jgi:hypothetical protein
MMHSLFLFLAVIGGLFVAYYVLCFTLLVIFKAILAAQYTNALRKAVNDKGLGGMKAILAIPFWFISQFIHLFGPFGQYTVGGSVGRYSWGRN